MSWQCTSWALREAPCPTATSRLVLIALADRCQPDGRSAWPSIKTLMLEAHTSEASVRRALRDLEKAGVIRRGNQELSRWDERGNPVQAQYRPIVWECCMGVALEQVSEKPGRQAREERARRRAEAGKTPSQEPTSVSEKSSPIKMIELENGGNKPKPSPIKMTGPENDPQPVDTPSSVTSDSARLVTSDRADLYITNPTTNTPSVPSGHLPGGEASEDEGADGEWVEYLAEVEAAPDPTDGLSESDAVADELLRRLHDIRSGAGLTTPEPTGRDRKAIRALHRRLQALHAPLSAFDLIVVTLRWAINRDWWAKRIRTGRQLARLWDEIEDDRAIEQRAVARHTSVRPVEHPDARHVHTAGCTHVRRLLDCGRAVDANPDPTRRRAHADQVLAWLEAGDDNASIAARLADLLREERGRRERDMAELARQRAANGGRMFAGARESLEVAS
ncbi:MULTISPECIES: helix-turn-helix domain-containing protein [Bifidobacterium]|uniref:Uncharacterized protein n=2 Tax=Bifidobacterium TaxID=1678 RepID=A0A261FPI9_9BIFI|nr:MULTISPECIES: helix-turn-helix domain-containing protein [Bifidobacterium]OZG60736.1 hypothetical protein BLEM_1705 [Bifidobacterium lemurum]OZG69634.1 hypothetical protein BEUL_0051 [Bifidobacterium eulemuris]QOL32252.1 helix-turn-helix domain-containing protein [Bifidobacterium eulemuris]QOL35212.1 helix-turn-helix domain-containing protein [Bifidobacterium lemurum]